MTSDVSTLLYSKGGKPPAPQLDVGGAMQIFNALGFVPMSFLIQTKST